MSPITITERYRPCVTRAFGSSTVQDPQRPRGRGPQASGPLFGHRPGVEAGVDLGRVERLQRFGAVFADESAVGDPTVPTITPPGNAAASAPRIPRAARSARDHSTGRPN